MADFDNFIGTQHPRWLVVAHGYVQSRWIDSAPTYQHLAEKLGIDG